MRRKELRVAPLTGWPSSYHYLDAAKRTGRLLGHGAQLFVGPEVLNILARVARGIIGAAKGAQVAAKLRKAAALQRGQAASEMVAGERVGETFVTAQRGRNIAGAGVMAEEVPAATEVLQTGQTTSKAATGAAKTEQTASTAATGEQLGEQIPKYVAYRANWENRSLKEAIEKFAPGSTAVPDKKLHKLVYINQKTRVKITYDTQGKYFRIQDGDGYPLDWNRQRVHRLKNMSSQEATDFVLKNSHFNDID